MKKIWFITSWDDGSLFDFRIANLLHRYNFPGIFFIPNITELSDDQIEHLDDMGFTIGGHTVNHPPDLKLLEGQQLKDEIVLNKKYLEDVIGKEIKWFCYPKGRYNDETIKELVEAGYKYARTTVSGSTKEIENPYRIKTSVHVYPQNNVYGKPDWEEQAKKLLNEVIKRGGVFHLWGHSWEVDKFNQWKQLESFLRYAQDLIRFNVLEVNDISLC